MACKTCKSERVAGLSAKCSDMCFINYPDGSEKDGYVPSDIGIGGGDYVEFDWCMDCGQIQSEFPVAIPDAEE